MNPLFRIDFSISDSLKIVRKSVLIYETIIGWTNQEIAQHMKISAHTVKAHVSAALQKLGVRQRRDLKKYMLK
ncbi:MAG: helix-turn-helix transcriptional regulator [Anaerovoracaceae bacterium]|nr:helix-turn-helix transcriptional regulator [Anaerovoracaceae bacterium]